MDIVFKCPQCEQELEVDASGVGSSIECPSCSQTIIVPAAEPGSVAADPAKAAPPPPEKHFVVPVHAVPTEGLISKAAKPLEVAAKESDKKLRIRTFKRTETQEVGRDHFDEVVSSFLEKVGQTNIVSINPITYSTIDLGTHQVLNDYGVLIVFKG